MSNLTTRAGKGSPLTNNELDANFTNLNSDKVEIGGDLSGTSSAPNVAKIQGRAVSADAPAIGEKLVWNGTAWEPSTDPTGEPIGHEDKSSSSISFNSGTRTFTISPVAANFVVWCKGVKYTYTSAQTVVIPDTTGLHFIYFNASGVLSTQMSYFTWEEHAPTAYVYWNSTTQQAVYFGDERHGITLDWQTHEYLHRTRGAAIASGFGASGYTTTGAGATDADAQIDIGGGTFFDEDLQVDIVSTNTPVAGTWQQDLSGPARIPVLYLNGSAWVIDAPTDFPFKVVSGVPQYNLYSGGTWSAAPVANNGYFVSWILATHNLTYPVIAVISQAATNQVSEAEAMTFEGLTLSGFPSVEFRPLYKVIYQHKTSFANNIKASTIAVYDLRSISSAGVAAALVQDHGNLSGLGDDDHAQYLHVSAVRSPSAAVTNSFLPSQASQSGKYLTTDGSNPSWGSIPSGSLTFTGDVTGTGTTGSSTTLTLSNSGAAAGTYTKVTVDAKGRVTTGALIDSSDVTTALGFTPENSANKAVANGYASLDGSGKVPSTQLPSYVDDVIEYANLAAFPATGESGKIYIAIDTAKTYRWSGSAYVEISASPGSTDAVTEGSTNLYFTNARARGAITATGSLSYNNQTGVLSYTQPTLVSTFTNDSNYLTGITGTQVTNALGYIPPQPNGTGATGTWSISISGNAATVSSITSAQVTTALGYTPYNATNPAGYTTNVGTVTSVSGTGTVSGLTLTGSVTSSGSLTLGGTLSLTSGQVTSALGFTPYNATNPSGYITGITSGMVTTALGYTPYNSTNPNGYITSSSNITGTAAGITGYTLADVTGTPTTVMTRNSGGDSAVGSRFHFTTCTADGGSFALVGLNWGGAAGTYKDFEVYDYPNSRPLFRAFGSTRNFEVYGALSAAGGLSVSGTSYYTFNKPSTSGYQTTALFGTTGGGLFITSDNAIISKGAYYNNGWIATATSGSAIDFSTSTPQIFYFSGATVGAAPSLSANYNILHAGNYGSGYFKTINGSSIIGTGDLTVSGTDNTKLPLTGGTLTGTLTGTTGRFQKNQTAGDYTTAAIWTESYGNTATGVAFHISGNVGKFLEMRTNGILYWNGDTVIHSGNYNSWAPSLTGSGASGTWSINITGNAATSTVMRYVGYAGDVGNLASAGTGIISNYNTGSAWTGAPSGMSYGSVYHLGGSAGGSILSLQIAADINHNSSSSTKQLWFRTSNNLGFQNDWKELLHSGNYSSYALPLSGGTLTGALTVGTTGSTSQTRALRVAPTGTNPSSFGSYSGSWRSAIEIWDNAATRMLHLTPPDGTNYNYSSIKSTDAGLKIDVGGSGGTNAVTFEANGVANFPQGLQQGGNQVLHAGNYSSYPLMRYAGLNSGNWQTFTDTSGELRVDQVNDINGGSHSNQPPNVYTYGGVLSWRTDNHSFQLYASHTGDLTFKTQWNNDNYSGWRRILHESNYNSFAPTLTGGNASGTWGISITGNADTVDSLHASSFSRKDTTNQWIKPYYEYGSYLTGETPANLRDQMGGGGLRVDFLHPGYTGSGGWNHVITWSGYNIYNMYQLGGHYDGGTGTDLWVRSEANHTGTSWTAWRKLLNSSNYNSYAPTLTGGGASGTWGINISGSAAQLNGYSSAENGASVVLRTASNGYLYLYNWINVASGGLFSGVNGAHFYPSNATYGAWRIDGSNNGWGGIAFGNGSTGVVNLMTASDSNSTGFHHQNYGWQFQWANGVFYIAKNAYGGNMAVALDSSNYSSYALPLGGGTVTGTANFSASTYPVFVYGNANTGSASSVGLQVYSTGGNGAIMAFHRGGYYAVNMGLDSDNVIRIGGWSASANRWQLDMSGNGTYAGNVTAYSDERLKKDWSPIESGFVDRLASIFAGTYTRIDSGERQAGVSAQKMREILPEVVSEDNEGTLALAYGNAAMVSAVELAKELVMLKKELAEIKSRLH